MYSEYRIPKHLVRRSENMIRMIQCRYCNTPIQSNEKFCPFCGAKVVKAYDKWWVWVLAFILAAGIIIGLAIKFPYQSSNNHKNSSNATNYMTSSPITADIKKISSSKKATESQGKNENNIGTSNTQSAAPSPKNENVGTLSNNGQYLVGKDLKPGLYKVTVMNTYQGRIMRASDTDFSTKSILADVIYMGDGYIRIKDTDAAIRIEGVRISPIKLDSIEQKYESQLGSGTYIVGKTIKPGNYQVKANTSGKAYIARLADVSMDSTDIIRFMYFKNVTYLTVADTDYAIHVEGATLTPSKS